MTKEEEEARLLTERLKIAVAAQDKAGARQARFKQEDLDDSYRRIKQSDMSPIEIAKDIDRSSGRGAAEGVAALPGTPADIYRLGQVAKAYVQGSPMNGWNPLAKVEYMGKTPDEVLAIQDAEREAGLRGIGPKPSTLAPYTGQGFIDKARPTNPALQYEPQTTLGEGTRRVSSVVSGGAAGGALGGLRSATRGAAGGLASGGAMEAARAADLPPSVQMAAGLIAGPLAARYGATTAEEAIGRGLGSRGATQFQVDRAEDMVTRARQEGIALTRANALDWITGGNAQGLSELQRVIESRGSPRLRTFFQENAPPGPTRARAYAERTLDRVAPESGAPSTIGPRVAEAQAQGIDATRANVNAEVRPQYEQFQNAPVPPTIVAAAQADPLWAAAARELDADPDFAHFLATSAQPGTVGYMQLVEQRLTQRHRDALRPATGAPDPQRAAGIAPSQRMAADVANASSWQGRPIPGQPSPLQVADQERAILQQQRIDPMEMGPEGRAARATTTEGVQEAIFPAQPLEGSHVEVERAIGNLAQQNPDLAREFARNYLGTEMHKAFAPNVGGEPYTAGTKFWNAVGGPPDSQQHQNIRAGIVALPNGAPTWELVQEMGELFSAQGKRQAVGSKTAFNAEDLERLKGQGWSAAALKLAGTNFKALGQEVSDRIDQFRLGRNMDEVARLLTDEQARAEFARIATSTTPRSTARTIQTTRALNRLLAAQTVRPVVDSPLHEPLGAP